MAPAPRPSGSGRRPRSYSPDEACPPPSPPPAAAAAAAAAAARLRDTPPMAAQNTVCPTCGDIIYSGNVIRCQCKKSPDHVKNDSVLKEKGISRPKSSSNYRMHHSKPEARVKLIPAEEIVSSAGLQKRHCRRSDRSVTPPPSSRKVSLVGSTCVTKEPMPPVSPIVSCTSERPETAENGHSLDGSYATNSFTAQIASLLKRPSPIFKTVLSQSYGTKAEASTPSSAAAPPGTKTEASTPSAAAAPPGTKAEASTPSSAAAPPGTKAEASTPSAAAAPPGTMAEASTPSAAAAPPGTMAEASTPSAAAVPPGTKAEASTPSAAAPPGPLVILHTKLHKKHYQPEACWKGKFEVSGQLTHACNGLEAHFALEIYVQVYEASKRMPEILKLEAVPLSQLWPKAFKMEPPDGQDIGLSFISSLQRPNRSADHLLENISSDIGLQTNIGATKLLIFSSKLLTQEYQKRCGKFYFWGVFQKLHRFCNQTSVEISNSSANADSCGKFEDIGTNLDLTDGKELMDATGSIEKDGINECVTVLKTSDPNTAHFHAILYLLDTPPGFPVNIPPGFTENHRLPLSVPGLVQTEVPPGFTKLLAVKREPGLPAICKDIEKVASIGEVDETNIMHGKVTADREDSSEERTFPRTRLISDIMCSPVSSNANANTAPRSTPINCTGVRESTSALSADTQEMEAAPEKQTQGRKEICQNHPSLLLQMHSKGSG